MTVDHGVDFGVDHQVEPARVEVPDDSERHLELVVPPPPNWHAPAPRRAPDDR